MSFIQYSHPRENGYTGLAVEKVDSQNSEISPNSSASNVQDPRADELLAVLRRKDLTASGMVEAFRRALESPRSSDCSATSANYGKNGGVIVRGISQSYDSNSGIGVGDLDGYCYARVVRSGVDFGSFPTWRKLLDMPRRLFLPNKDLEAVRVRRVSPGVYHLGVSGPTFKDTVAMLSRGLCTVPGTLADAASKWSYKRELQRQVALEERLGGRLPPVADEVMEAFANSDCVSGNSYDVVEAPVLPCDGNEYQWTPQVSYDHYCSAGQCVLYKPVSTAMYVAVPAAAVEGLATDRVSFVRLRASGTHLRFREDVKLRFVEHPSVPVDRLELDELLTKSHVCLYGPPATFSHSAFSLHEVNGGYEGCSGKGFCVVDSANKGDFVCSFPIGQVNCRSGATLFLAPGTDFSVSSRRVTVRRVSNEAAASLPFPMGGGKASYFLGGPTIRRSIVKDAIAARSLNSHRSHYAKMDEVQWSTVEDFVDMECLQSDDIFRKFSFGGFTVYQPGACHLLAAPKVEDRGLRFFSDSDAIHYI